MAKAYSKSSVKISLRLGVPVISASPTTLDFSYTAAAGSTTTQDLVISNTGENPSVLKWAAVASGSSDMGITVTPAAGELEQGASATVKVSVESGKSTGSYAGLLVVSDTASGTTVTSVNVVVTLAVSANTPAVFYGYEGAGMTGHKFTLTQNSAPSQEYWDSDNGGSVHWTLHIVNGTLVTSGSRVWVIAEPAWENVPTFSQTGTDINGIPQGYAEAPAGGGFPDGDRLYMGYAT